MTLIISRNYKGNQWLISDTLVSSRVSEGQLAILPTGPVPSSLVADNQGKSVIGLASKIEIIGDFAIAYSGNLELAKGAIHTLRTLYEIDELDINAVERELTNTAGSDPARPVGFFVHAIVGDHIQLHTFDAERPDRYLTCGNNAFAMGSGAPWFTRWLKKQAESPLKTASTAMSEDHSELASWLSSDGKDDNPLEQGFGGLYDTVVPVKVDGTWRFSRLADTTTVYWPIYDQGWVETMRDGIPTAGGDVLIPSQPSVVYTKRGFKDGLLIQINTKMGPIAGDWLVGFVPPPSATSGSGWRPDQLLAQIPKQLNTRLMHIVVAGAPLSFVWSNLITRSDSQLLAARLDKKEPDIWITKDANGKLQVQVTDAMRKRVFDIVRQNIPDRICKLVNIHPKSDSGSNLWCKDTAGFSAWVTPGTTATWEVLQ
jgi:hypothetical protein